MTVGAFYRNTILVLPEKEYTDDELDMIFSHELVHIIREDGMTIIVVTHESGVANEADKIIHISDGIIGKVEENVKHDNWNSALIK